MTRARFTEEQIIGILKEKEADAKRVDVCRKRGISNATFCKHKAKCGGMDVSDARKPKAFKDKNAKLNKLLADAMLAKAILKDVAAKNDGPPRSCKGTRHCKRRLQSHGCRSNILECQAQYIREGASCAARR